MGWVDLTPSVKATHLGPITLRIKAPTPAKSGKGGRKGCVVIAIRVQKLPEITWFTHGAGVNVAVGAGADLGKVRITPKGPFRVVCTRTPGKRETPFVRIPQLADAPDGRAGVMAAGFDYDVGWIEIDLPWATVTDRGVPEIKVPSPASPVPKGAPAKEPYRGILAQTPMTHAGRGKP
jgi:hypothetical protein